MPIIQCTTNQKTTFFQALGPKDKPVFTPIERQAHVFPDLAKCQNVRDHVLEYVDKATILRS